MLGPAGECFRLATESHSRNKNNQFYFVSSPFRLGWRYGNHPEEIYANKCMWSKLDYIHLNPVRAGIFEKASQYIYSSASNYVYGKIRKTFILFSTVKKHSTKRKVRRLCGAGNKILRQENQSMRNLNDCLADKESLQNILLALKTLFDQRFLFF
jgi:hypothetical protein